MRLGARHEVKCRRNIRKFRYLTRSVLNLILERVTRTACTSREKGGLIRDGGAAACGDGSVRAKHMGILSEHARRESNYSSSAPLLF